MDNIQPGQMLGPYRIINQIGKGGMANVYKAYQPSIDRYVAIKVLPSQLAGSQEFTARFQQEARIIARLEHPHILPVFDYGGSEGTAYFVMRFLEAGTLKDQLYDAMHRGEDLGVDLVVLDEAHYLGDMDRGVVWEEVLIYLPQRIRILLLSATIQNAQQVCDWLTWLRKSPCRLLATYERPVPLFPLFLFPSGELVPLSTRRGLFAPIRGVTSKGFSRRDFPNVAGLLSVLRQLQSLAGHFFPQIQG